MTEPELIELCEEYTSVCKAMLEDPGMYALDCLRTSLHNELCDNLDLNPDDTKHITTCLEKIDFDGVKLYNLLKELK